MSTDLAVFKLYEYQDDYDLLHEMSEVDTDINGEKYKIVTQTLANDDYYQGLNLTSVIQRLSDGKLFGYTYFEDISKHGETYIDSNGDDFGYEGDCEVEDDYNTFYSYYVFRPVEQWTLEGYRVVES